MADNIKNDSKSFYAYVRGISKATKKIGPIANSQGELVDSSEGMCELLNQAFGEVFTKEDLSDIPQAKWEYSENGGLGLCDRRTPSDDFRIMKILHKLSEDKAAGADEFVPRFLRKIKHQLARPLTMLFNNIMKSGQVPADWKEANVVPVFKRGSRNVARPTN